MTTSPTTTATRAPGRTDQHLGETVTTTTTTATATTTRAAFIRGFGTPAVFAVGEFAVDEPGPGQVRVKVAYSAVNPVDLGIRAGRVLGEDQARFPMVLGWDAEGTVEALGPDVTGLTVGESVFACTQQPATQVGTHADLVVLDQDQVAPAPAGWGAGKAAALGLSGITAYQAVAALQLQPGQRLLVNNPVGFVGQLAVQIAKAQGLRVLATVAPEHAARAGANGAEQVLDAGEGAEERVLQAVPGGVDGALDLLGGPAALRAFAAVRDGGRYVTVIPEWWIGGGQYQPARGITPVVVENNPNRQDLEALAELAAAGHLHFDIAGTYSLDTLGDAHQALARSGVLGKIVVKH